MTSTLTLKRVFDAAPSVVFDAWLDPEALRRFMCPAPGTSVTEAQCDAREGGTFSITMRVGHSEVQMRGEYTAIEPYTRLAFTWRSASAGDRSAVTLTFKPIGANQTELTLQHRGLPTEHAQSAHQKGWTLILGHLEARGYTHAPEKTRG